MGKIDELIEKMCPNGVEYKKIDDVFYKFNGMTGVSNKWKKTGNCQFIDYMNAYKNLKIDVKRLENATIKKMEQSKLKKGDILLTSASETPDECAISSVIEDEIVDNIFLDDHLFGIRLKDEYINNINTTFVNYYMHTKEFRKNVFKAVRGVTRFYISVDTFMNTEIPVPPLEVQCEIVRVLDDFTLLSAELSAELKARQKQYEYYRDKLLPFDKMLESTDTLVHTHGYFNRQEIKCYKLGEIAKNVFSGKNKERVNNGEYPVYGSTGIISSTNNAVYNKTQILIARVGANAGYVYIATDKYDVSDNALIVDLDDNVNIKYIYYQLANMNLNQFAKGGGQPLITAGQMKEIIIPVPPVSIQERIVNILDRFEKLCNDISEGLPAEIEARQKQYEYYRDKLLTFKELKIN